MQKSISIFEILRADHDEQRRLLDLLLKTSGDNKQRRELYAEIKLEMELHAAAEERHFYIPLIEKDMTQDKARHSVAEHNELEEMLEALAETEFSSGAWLRKARDLGDRLIHHLEEEEHEVFQLAGRVLSERQKSNLAREYITMMEDGRASSKK